MSYKVVLRVRPIDYNQFMIQTHPQTIEIKDPTNKQADWQSYKFDRIFDEKISQETVFNECCPKDLITKSACFLSYGQSGSGNIYTMTGKSYTIYGTQQQPGILPQFVDYLLKSNVELTASFQEIYVDQIRDLIANQQSDTVVKKSIKSTKEVFEILQIMQKTDLKRQFMTHTIFTLEHSQGTYQFVDLAGSERVAKNLLEGDKYKEAIMVNATHTTLGRCLTMFNQQNTKPLPLNDSKLTKQLQLTQQTHVVLLGNINPSESNYEECLATIQFLDRTKNIQTNLRKGFSLLDDNKTSSQQQEKIIKKLTDEVEMMKAKVDQVIADKKKKFLDIQKLLGLDIDLERLSAKQAKEMNQFKIQSEALVKNQQLQQIISQHEETIETMKYEITLLKEENARKQEKYSQLQLEQKEVIKSLKDQLQMNKMSADDQVRQLTNEREVQIKRMIDSSNQLLEEKISSVLNLPYAAQAKGAESQKLQEVRKITKQEAEREFQKLLESIKSEYQKLMLACKSQYENLITDKNNEIESFLTQFKQYRQKKKNQITELGEELVDLYDICMKQAKIIEKIENGVYSAGIKSFSIPKQDKPNLPVRSKHKNLYKFIDNRSQNNTLTKKGTINEKTIRNTPKHFRQSQSQKDVITDIIDTSQLEQLNLQLMDFTTLRAYAIKFRDLIREQQDQFIIIQDKLKQQIQTLTKERDDIQNRYNIESKKYNQTRVVIESQNRILSKVRPLSSVVKKY